MPDLSYIGSSGTAVAAALETAGHFAQSVMLNDFSVAEEGGIFGHKLAALLYLIGVIGALITLASGGSYRFGLYLLIGPSLFFFLVGTRVPSSGAEWKFGDRDFSQAQVRKAVEGLDGGEAGAGNVSIFFSAWNQITSGAVQGAIRLLHLTDRGLDRDFLSKGDRYLAVFNTEALDPQLRGFMEVALAGKCANYINFRVRLANPNVPDLNKAGTKVADANYDGTSVAIDVKDFPHIKTWMESVFAGEAEATKEKFTCVELWDTSIKALKKIEVTKAIDILVKSGIEDGLSEQQVRDRLLFKFGQTIESTGVITEISASGVGGENALMGFLINELAARMLYHQLQQVNPAMQALTLTSAPHRIEEGGQEFAEDTARMMRVITRAEEYQYKGEVVIAALTLPYIQGVILFFLAAAFPFFAVTLVLPGRHTAFLLWMGLWLWAKLWDLGIAVVMMIDNMLYALLPHGPPMTEGMLDDPGLMVKNLLEVDPTYSVHTYFSLLSSCILAVPIVTGFLVHKGGNEVIDAVTATFRQFPSKFGNSMSGWGRANQSQHNLALVRRAEFQGANGMKWLLPFVDKGISTSGRAAGIASILSEASPVAQTIVGQAGIANSGPAKFFNNAVGGAFSEGTKALGEHHKQHFNSRMSYALEMASYMQTKSHNTWSYDANSQQYVKHRQDFAYKMAAEAVGLKYNSHDWRQSSPPTDAMVDSVTSSQYLGVRGASDTLTNKWIHGKD